MNTLRQLTKKFNQHENNINFAFPSVSAAHVNSVIAFQTAASREEYLEWVALWKKANARVVKAIKELKAVRSTHPLNEADLAVFRSMAHRLYVARAHMKDISHFNKLEAEIERIEKLFLEDGIVIAA